MNVNRYPENHIDPEDSPMFLRFFTDHFVSAYYIGLEDFTCKTYMRIGNLEMRYPLPNNYLDSINLYIDQDVALEDQETMRQIVKPDYLKKRLKEEETFTYLLRDVSGGIDKFYRFEAIRGDDEDHAAICFIDVTDEVDKQLELKEAKQRLKTNEIISVLSSEYNAVYYCNEDTHDYEILFQQGFVKDELRQLKAMCPKYEDGFNYYIKAFVHPDDRENMKRELMNVPSLLQTRKSVRIEFRRLYGEKYFYTEMYVVKTDDADKPLHNFVAGFLRTMRFTAARLTSRSSSRQ